MWLSLAPGSTASCHFSGICSISTSRMLESAMTSVLVSAFKVILQVSFLSLRSLADSCMRFLHVLNCLFFGPGLLVVCVGVASMMGLVFFGWSGDGPFWLVSGCVWSVSFSTMMELLCSISEASAVKFSSACCVLIVGVVLVAGC